MKIKKKKVKWKNNKRKENPTFKSNLSSGGVRVKAKFLIVVFWTSYDRIWNEGIIKKKKKVKKKGKYRIRDVSGIVNSKDHTFFFVYVTNFFL